MAGRSGVLWTFGVRYAPGLYTIIGGVRTRSFKINNNPVDVTTADSASRARELLATIGAVEMEINGSGLYQKDANNNLLPSLASSGASANFLFVSEIPTVTRGVEIIGDFIVNEYESSATFNEAMSFTVKMTSVGTPSIIYQPAATTPL